MNLLGPIFLENFQSTVIDLQGALMFVAYFILLTGLIVRLMRVSESNADMVSMIKPVFTCFFIVALIATISFWFEKLDEGFYHAAETINANFGSEPFEVSDALLEAIEEDPEAEGWGVDRIVNSVYLALVFGTTKFFITLAALFQIPFLILQYALTWLGFLFLPIGLALFIFPSLSNIGVKLISNILAVMAWPIGFAITNLAAISFINDFATSSTFTGNNTGSALYMMSFGSMIMGLVAALILIVGTLATPTIMFLLFSSGAILEGATNAATGAAAFATYMGGSMGILGGQRGGAGSAPAPSGGGSSEGPAPTGGYEGIGGGGGYQVNEPVAAYGNDGTTGAVSYYRHPTSSSPTCAIAGNSAKALPAPQDFGNPLLADNAPNDPTGDQHAARIFALNTAPQAVITI
ncbi:hypothetical protein QEH59_14615 [Coraliomargarita sp. SDUM461004]|uniref:Type IV secretion system protein n=1 Tax=Thalassobacterium sedimentorum TaxID=3041258 RepID=A0ABU1ALX2_9BACT|nr:hypothetical protein [Coraliomargarita sp. SDUM461004]MDQ8195664.1 hypothetical protein [Coraliomargarita sp. SDUM461004]